MSSWGREGSFMAVEEGREGGLSFCGVGRGKKRKQHRNGESSRLGCCEHCPFYIITLRFPEYASKRADEESHQAKRLLGLLELGKLSSPNSQARHYLGQLSLLSCLFIPLIVS